MNFLFRKMYLRRFISALKNLQKPKTSRKGDESDNPCSSHTVKLAADVSLALTCKGSAWGRALNIISRDQNNRPALRRFLQPNKFLAIIAHRARYQSRLKFHSRSQNAHMKSHRKPSQTLYRCFYSKRLEPLTSSNAGCARELQRLVPGGKSMGASCLLRETADYISCLTTQVEVLKSLVNSPSGD